MVLCLAAAILAGCSDEGGAPTTSATSTVPASTSPQLAGTVTVPSSSTVAPAPAPAPPYEVSIDVSVDSAGVEGQLAVAVEAGELDEIDPFTRFSSCSGLRASVGTYVVTAADADADGDVRSVTVLTSGRVAAAGIHDADVRVEFAGREPVTAVGTVTLDDDLRSGTFQAFESTGERVDGAFRCDGPPGVAVPIDDAATVDGVLSAVEVVALLRQDGAERVVGLTLDTSEVMVADARCPGIDGSDDPVLVSVAGGQAIGAINEFELTADPVAKLRMRVGGASYSLDDAVVAPDATGGAGTFAGTTADGVMVDGAYRCS